MAARDEGGPFLSLFDFCQRVDGRKVNRKVLEALVKAGAFDGVAAANGVTRARLFGAIDLATERAAEAQRERESGQTTCSRCSAAAAPAATSAAGDAAAARTSTPTSRSGCPSSCSRSRRRRSASTSAATRSIATPARSAATPTPRAANCIEKGERAEVILAGVVDDLSGAPDEERRRQVRLLHARGPHRPDRVHRQLARRSRSTARSCRATSRCW